MTNTTEEHRTNPNARDPHELYDELVRECGFSQPRWRWVEASVDDARNHEHWRPTHFDPEVRADG